MMYDLFSLFKVVQSKSNAIIKDVALLQEGGSKAGRFRKETGLALIEGIHLMDTWLSAKKTDQLHTIITSSQGLEHPEIRALLLQCVDLCMGANAKLPEFILLEDALQPQVTQMPEAPFIQCLIRIPSKIEIQYTQDLVILDAIQDAGNVGTILRTCAAAGVTQVISTQGTAAAWSSKVLRAGMGAHVGLTILEGVLPRHLLANIEIPMFCTQLQNAKSIYTISEKLKNPIVWVFGNEGQGICPELVAQGTSIYIPQVQAVESLNVSAAAAIALFETRRVRLYSEYQ